MKGEGEVGVGDRTALYGWREGSEGDRVEAGAGTGIGRGVSRKMRMKPKKNNGKLWKTVFVCQCF